MKRVPVKKVAKIVNGKTPKGVDDKFQEEGNVPFFRVSDMNVEGNDVEMRIARNTVSTKDASTLKLKIAKPGTVIFPKRGGAIATNKKRILVKPSAYDLNTMGLTPNEKVINKYFYYWFDSIDLGALADGSSVPQLNNKQIEPLEIPLPSLSEQKAIVAKLDRAQRLIDIDKEMLAKYDELIQSVFLEMFGDPKSNSKKINTGKLGDYAFINMGQSPKGSSYNEEGNGEPLLNGPTEFGEKYPTEKQWTTEPKKFAETNDILFCVRGATAGRTNLADNKYCIGRGLAAIRGEEKLDTTFIHFVLKSLYEYFQNEGQGSTFINIAKKDLSNLEVPIPSQKMQNEFILASKKIENQKQVTKASQKQSKELFSSLVQGAFG